MYTPLDFIFARPGAIRLLRALEPLDVPVSAREAARRAGLTHAATSILDQLRQVGILTRQETPAQHLYLYNRQHVLSESISYLLRTERDAEQLLLDEVRRILSPFHVVSAVFYGSRASGGARPSGDLDVLVIVRGEEEVDGVYRAFVDGWDAVRARFGVSLSPVVMHADEAKRQWAGGNAFLLNAARDARPVTGAALEGVLE